MTIGAPMSPDSPSSLSWPTMELIYRMAMDGGHASVRFIRIDLRARQPRHLSRYSSAMAAGCRAVRSMSYSKLKD